MKKPRHKGLKKYLIIIWMIFFIALSSIPLLFFAVKNGIFGALPTADKIENPRANLASEIYSSDGQLLGKFYTQNRTRVEFDNISRNVIDALISTEDERFKNHSGVDLESTFRAIIFLGKKGGGSTITQQLAKMLFTKKSGKSINRVKQKLKEYVVSVELEKRYTKNEIIALYLNQFDFVNNAVGIKSASKVYFNKEPAELTINEAALLVGMLKNPSRFNPLRFEERAVKRRNIVLSQMVRNKKISHELKDSLANEPLGIRYTREDHIEGLAPYFRSSLALELRNWAKNTLKSDGDNYNIYRDGLKIYTTIDSRMQQFAEEAVREHLSEYQKLFVDDYDKNIWEEDEGKRILNTGMKQSDTYIKLKENGASNKEITKYFNTKKKMTIFTWEGKKDTVMTPMDSIKHHKLFLQTGFLVMDPYTGHIKAWVGGIDFEHFKYDHANKYTKRLVGSTFKPILYSLAIDNGWSPCMKIPNAPVTIYTDAGQPWTPENAGNHKYGGYYTLRECLSQSINTCAAYIMKELTPEVMVTQAKLMGLKSDPMPLPSLALGAIDVSIWEMMHIYSTFINAGVSTQPIFISRIEDKNGTEIQHFITERKEALSEQTAYVMLDLLKGVTNTGGTASRVKWMYEIPGEVAGKTGTTNDHTDGWFIGMTPELLGGVWVGCDDQALRFKSLKYGQGGRMALPIWSYFFKKAFNSEDLGLSTDAKFFEPEFPLEIELDCAEYNKTHHDDPGNIFEQRDEQYIESEDEHKSLEDEFE